MESVCKTVSRGTGKTTRWDMDCCITNNPSIQMHDSYDVERPSSRSPCRHIVHVASEHTGVKPSVCLTGSMPNGCLCKHHDWKVPLPYMNYIWAVLGIQPGRDMIRVACKTWYNVNMSSLIIADGAVITAFKTVTNLDDKQTFKFITI